MGTWLRFSIDWWYSVVCCIYRLFWLFFNRSTRNKVFSRQSHHSPSL